ncbi:MAG: hypothetical protein KDB10_16150, partial [Acidimicrobiales bacterium]|nr:hypothetical protein [Acidimicrobiales bacterium]
CLRCQAELARYRRMLRGLQLLRTQYFEPAPGLLAATLANITAAGERRAVTSVLTKKRLAYAGAVAGAVAGVVMQLVGYEVLDSLYYDALPAALNQVGSAQEAATYGALFWAAFGALLGAAALLPVGDRDAGGLRRLRGLALAGAIAGALSGLLLVSGDLGTTRAGSLVESLVVGAALGLAAAATTRVPGGPPAPTPPP